MINYLRFAICVVAMVLAGQWQAAWGAARTNVTTLLIPVRTFAGANQSRRLTLQAQENPLATGTNISWGPPIAVTPTNGVGVVSNIAPANYRITMEGAPGYLMCPVPDTNGVVSVVGLATNLMTFTYAPLGTGVVLNDGTVSNLTLLGGPSSMHQGLSNHVAEPYQPYVAGAPDSDANGAYSYWRSNYQVSVDFTNAHGVVLAIGWDGDAEAYQNSTLKKGGVDVVSAWTNTTIWPLVSVDMWGWPHQGALSTSGTIGWRTNTESVGFEITGPLTIAGLLNGSRPTPYLSPEWVANPPRMVDGTYRTYVDRGAIFNGTLLNLSEGRGIVRSIYIMGPHITEEDPYWLRIYPDCGNVTAPTTVASTNGAAVNMWLQSVTSHVYDRTNMLKRFWSTRWANVQRGSEHVHSFELRAAMPFTNGILIGVYNSVSNAIVTDAADGPWWAAVTYETGTEFAHFDDGRRLHIQTRVYNQLCPVGTKLKFMDAQFGPGVLLGLWLSVKPIWPQLPAGTSGFFEGGWWLNGQQIAAGGDDIFVAGYTFGSYTEASPRALSSEFYFGVPSVEPSVAPGNEGYVECYKMWDSDAPFWKAGEGGNGYWEMTNGGITTNQAAVFTSLYYAPMH